MIRSAIAILLVLTSACAQAVGFINESPPKPPFALTDQSRIDAGKARFNATCNMFCHGNEGSGGKTPAFKGRSDFTPEMLFGIISHGIKPGMPAYGENLSEEKRWELIAYILYLGRQKAQ
jgi:mono/diheme cytochrome c family protein